MYLLVDIKYDKMHGMSHTKYSPVEMTPQPRRTESLATSYG